MSVRHSRLDDFLESMCFVAHSQPHGSGSGASLPWVAVPIHASTFWSDAVAWWPAVVARFRHRHRTYYYVVGAASTEPMQWHGDHCVPCAVERGHASRNGASPSGCRAVSLAVQRAKLIVGLEILGFKSPEVLCDTLAATRMRLRPTSVIGCRGKTGVLILV